MELRRILKLVQGKCPNCEEEDIFNKSGNIFLLRPPKMPKQCSSCSHIYELEPGYFFGAMYVSYGLSVAELVGTYIITQFFVEDITVIFIILCLTILLLSFFNFKYSRIIWMYMFTKKTDK
jgi:hypothetical protein